MEFRTRIINCDSRSDRFDIVPLSCIHVGPKAFDKDKFRKAVKRIKDNPSALWFSIGDNFDGINRSDKRFDGGEVDPEICPNHESLDELAENQLDWLVSETECIADKCLGIGCGNHEETLRTRYHTNIHKRYYKHIGSLSNYCTPETSDLGYSGILRLKFSRHDRTRNLKINYFHGKGGGGGEAQLNQMALEQNDCDIYSVGHLHKCRSWRERTVDIAEQSDTLVESTRIYIQAGTFLRTKMQGARTYSEVKGHKMSALGCTCVRVFPHHEDGKKYELFENCEGLPPLVK